MQKHTVTLCMIVKNEEKYLDRCLGSVKGKVDEIIVVDTGSTDNTIEIARKYGASVKHFTWIDDFAAARNYSIEGVTSDYILVLDADEYLDESADLQTDLGTGKDFYRLTIKNYQSKGQVLYHQNVRLFRSGVGLRYSGKLHENLNTYDEGSNYSGIDSYIIIHHVGYLPEVIVDKSKNKRNYEIMVKELEDNPTGYSYFNMGIVYMNDEHYDKALDMFDKAYPLSKHKKYVKNLLVLMAECLQHLERTEEGIGLLLDAEKNYPQNAELHYKLGVLYLKIGLLRDAEVEFRRCLEIGEKIDNITIEGVGSYKACHQLSIVYDRMGRVGDAFDEAYKAVTQKKNFTPALSKYVKLMQSAGVKPEEIKEHLSKVYTIDTAEELKALVYSLYELRHPLMNEFGFAFMDEQLYEPRAIAFMLDKQFDRALKEWEKVEVISQSNILDAVVLCLLTKATSLANKIKSSSNYCSEEWELISSILLREDIENFTATSEVEELLLNISEYLLIISEFEQFEYITSFLLFSTVETQEKLALMLMVNGYTDTVVELLGLILENNPKHFESNLLLCEAYLRQEKLEDAMATLLNTLSLKEDYRVYEKLYDTYEKMGEADEMKKLKKVMKDKFPLAMWLKNA